MAGAGLLGAFRRVPRGRGRARAHLPAPDNSGAFLPRLYHRFLVYDIMRRPAWTRLAERLLNPLVGKSLVVYLAKPGADA